MSTTRLQVVQLSYRHRQSPVDGLIICGRGSHQARRHGLRARSPHPLSLCLPPYYKVQNQNATLHGSTSGYIHKVPSKPASESEANIMTTTNANKPNIGNGVELVDVSAARFAKFIMSSPSTFRIFFSFCLIDSRLKPSTASGLELVGLLSRA